MADLSNVGTRSGLKPKPGNAPYFNRIHAGCFVGYRPSQKDDHGKWIARVYDEDSQKYRQKRLGNFGELENSKRFRQAKIEAEKFAQIVEAGGEIEAKIETVADACREYVGKIKSPEKRKETEQRFNRCVFNQPIAKVKLEKLRKGHLEQWREWLEAQPALVSRSKHGERNTRTRAASTINRDMVPLRAALSKVLAKGNPNTPSAWQEALVAIRKADGRRTLYLDRTQRRALLAQIDNEAAPFLKALCLLPLRPGAMAELSVGDFDGRTGLLSIAKDKVGETRKIAVSGEAARLLIEQLQSKLPAAPIFMRTDGSRWTRHTWKRPIALAAKAAGLPIETTAYTLRHSTITDLVKAGLPLLTIAQISGTSAEMIERHYGQLTNQAAMEALEGLAL